MKITLYVRHKWWLKYYLAGIELMMLLTGQMPDLAKLDYWLSRGLIVEFVK